jgi:signal transduction histidine kinase
MRGEERVEVSMSRLVEAVVAQLRCDERFASVSFETQLDTDQRLSIVEGRLSAAVRNLLENAASFAGQGGRVQVRLRREPRQLLLEVEDSGPGIARDDLPRVFDRFFTRREGGTGLGLALVRAVVEAHDGLVEARSEPGRGACFCLRFALPAA